MARDVVRLLHADANPGELIWEAVAHGAPRAEFGWGHSVASATDCLSMVDLYEGDQRALPIVQGIVGIAESERDRPVNALPDPVGELGRDPAATFRSVVEAERLDDAQALLRGAIDGGDTAPTTCGRGSPTSSATTCCRTATARSTPRRRSSCSTIGWERADTVLPHLVPTIVYGTREDKLPYMRPFTKALAGARPRGPGRGRRRPVMARRRDAGARRCSAPTARPCCPRRSARCATAPASTACSTWSSTPSASACCATTRRASSTSPTTSAGSTSRTGSRTPTPPAGTPRTLPHHPDTVRLALWSVFLAQWTGRHEWHTTVGEPAVVDLGTPDLVAAGEALQRQALGDTTSAFIVHAHAVKTSRAAARGGGADGVVASAGGRGPVHRRAEAGTLRGGDGRPARSTSSAAGSNADPVRVLGALGARQTPYRERRRRASSAGGLARTS